MTDLAFDDLFEEPNSPTFDAEAAEQEGRRTTLRHLPQQRGADASARRSRSSRSSRSSFTQVGEEERRVCHRKENRDPQAERAG